MKQIPYISAETTQKTLSSYILSASGWRRVFARSQDPESTEAEIADTDAMLSSMMAEVFLRFLQDDLQRPNEEITILVAADSRPTGPAIAEMILRTIISRGAQVIYTGVTPAPETMAYSRLYEDDIDGFIYISASHNPAGYNGVKFGRQGKVLSAAAASQLISSYRTMSADQQQIDSIRELLNASDDHSYARVLGMMEEKKSLSAEAYRMFTSSVASGSLYICSQDQVYNTIRAYAESNGLGVVIDYNGSARSCSIDEGLLSSIGVTVREMNKETGVFAHRIVPEGESLDQCRAALEEAYREDPSFVFGYVPDCDGDRGNIVYIDENTAEARILEAQEVFALSVLAELAYTRSKDSEARLAVAVNGPTSMRIDRIAAAFGAQVHRAEVGEANVVELAERLRGSGYEVRILGEGSNGGNITYPASVRDPLNTVLSLLKLLSFRGNVDQKGLFRLWCENSGQESAYNQSFSFSDIIATLPAFITTSAYEQRALLHIQTKDQEELKTRYEKGLARVWEEDQQFFRSLGITSYREINTIGTEAHEGAGKHAREASSTGGLKILFYDKHQQPTDFIWMRGSKTEPVFRVLADCEGSDPTREQKLLDLHKKLIGNADRKSEGTH